MTEDEAIQERGRIREVVKNWRAKDPWHQAMYDRYNDLGSFLFCNNGKDPGPWEMPPIPEGVEP